jgi:hypothetical protein
MPEIIEKTTGQTTRIGMRHKGNMNVSVYIDDDYDAEAVVTCTLSFLLKEYDVDFTKLRENLRSAVKDSERKMKDYAKGA